MVRATILLTRECNNSCVFCGQVATEPPVLQDPFDQLERLRGSQARVSFVGGEPTLRDELEALVGRAAELRYERIGLQTNGAVLAPDRVQRLRAAGLTDLHISVLGGTAAVHDHHTGVPGSLALLEDVARSAASCGLPLYVATVVTRSNFRSVSDILAWVRRARAAAWVLELPLARGRALDAFDRVMPRLALTLPHLLRAVTQAASAGIEARVRGAPACLVGPMHALVLPSLPRAYAPRCEGCPARAGCPGVDAAYLERFGGDELRHRLAFEPESPPGWADVFVGCVPG